MMLSESRLVSEATPSEAPQADPVPLEPVAELSVGGDDATAWAFLNADATGPHALLGFTLDQQLGVCAGG